MIVHSADQLRTYLDTLVLRDGEDFVAVTMPLEVWRELIGRLTDDSSATYTSKDVGRR